MEANTTLLVVFSVAHMANLIVGIGLALIALIEIGLFVYFLRYEKTLSIKAYLALVAGVILWVAGNSISYLRGTGDVSNLQDIAYIGGTLLISSLLLFAYSFPFPMNAKRTIQVLRFFPALSVIVFGVAFLSTRSYEAILQENTVMTTIHEQPWALCWSYFFLVVWAWALVILITRFVRSQGDIRQRLRYLLIGVVISSFVGVLTDVFFPLFDVVHYGWIGPSFSVVWLWFTVKAIRFQPA